MLRDFFRNMFSDEDDFDDEDEFEEEDDEEEEIIEPIRSANYYQPQQQEQTVQPAPSMPQQQPLYVEPEVQPSSQSGYAAETNAKAKEEKKASTLGISVSEVDGSRKSQKKQAQGAPYKFDRSKLQKPKVRIEPAQPEYNDVISPIFGNLEETKKDFGKVHDAINLAKPDSAAAFTGIISPMYGNSIPKEEPQTIPEYEMGSFAKANQDQEKKGAAGLSELISAADKSGGDH